MDEDDEYEVVESPVPERSETKPFWDSDPVKSSTDIKGFYGMKPKEDPVKISAKSRSLPLFKKSKSEETKEKEKSEQSKSLSERLFRQVRRLIGFENKNSSKPSALEKDGRKRAHNEYQKNLTSTKLLATSKSGASATGDFDAGSILVQFPDIDTRKRMELPQELGFGDRPDSLGQYENPDAMEENKDKKKAYKLQHEKKNVTDSACIDYIFTDAVQDISEELDQSRVSAVKKLPIKGQPNISNRTVGDRAGKPLLMSAVSEDNEPTYANIIPRRQLSDPCAMKTVPQRGTDEQVTDKVEQHLLIQPSNESESKSEEALTEDYLNVPEKFTKKPVKQVSSLDKERDPRTKRGAGDQANEKDIKQRLDTLLKPKTNKPESESESDEEQLADYLNVTEKQLPNKFLKQSYPLESNPRCDKTAKSVGGDEASSAKSFEENKRTRELPVCLDTEDEDGLDYLNVTEKAILKTIDVRKDINILRQESDNDTGEDYLNIMEEIEVQTKGIQEHPEAVKLKNKVACDDSESEDERDYLNVEEVHVKGKQNPIATVRECLSKKDEIEEECTTTVLNLLDASEPQTTKTALVGRHETHKMTNKETDSTADQINVNNTSPQIKTTDTLNVKGLTISELGYRLRELHLSKYVDPFAKNDIDGMIVSLLNEEDLMTEMRMSKIEAARLLNFVKTGHIPK